MRNVIRTALAISESGVIGVMDLPREIRESASPLAPASTQIASAIRRPAADDIYANPLAAAEHEALMQAIERHRWNMSHAASSLGISRNTLYRKIKFHGIAVASARRDRH